MDSIKSINFTYIITHHILQSTSNYERCCLIMSILHADGHEIEKEIQNEHFVMVDCWAPWCPPCRMLSPILEDIHQQFGLKIVKVNADENDDFISKFQVLGLPTLLLFQDGQLVDRITGFRPKEALIGELKELKFLEN